MIEAATMTLVVLGIVAVLSLFTWFTAWLATEVSVTLGIGVFIGSVVVGIFTLFYFVLGT